MRTFVNFFGLAVRLAREEQQWSQEMLAEKADLNRSYIGELERGQAVPSLTTMHKIALATGLRLSELVARAERMQQSQLGININLASIAC